MAFDADADAQQVQRLHLREALEPSPVFRDVIARIVVPQHNALAGLLARHCGLTRPDAGIHQLAFALVALANDYCVSREFISLLAPKVLSRADAEQPHRRPPRRLQRRAARARDRAAPRDESGEDGAQARGPADGARRRGRPARLRRDATDTLRPGTRRG